MIFFPVPNDWILYSALTGLVCCILWDLIYLQKVFSALSRQEKKKKTFSKSRVFSPIYKGSQSNEIVHHNMMTLHNYMPINTYLVDSSKVEDQLRRKSKSRNSKINNKLINTNSNVSQSRSRLNTAESVSSVIRVSDLCNIVIPNLPPGCEPDGEAAKELHKKFPNLSKSDIVRFLVARKGDVEAATEMLNKYLDWRNLNFPVTKEKIAKALETKCFFPYGQAVDGSPVVYMRGGLYDNTRATAEQFTLAAAYTIEHSLKQYPDQLSVTVVVHTSHVAEGPNAPADTHFIKLFIQVLSDNFPERLRRLVIFPFPWYGRAIWSVLKVFVDKRTQDKVLLLSCSAKAGIPEELKKFVDPKSMPTFCGGTCTDPIPDLSLTLES